MTTRESVAIAIVATFVATSMFHRRIKRIAKEVVGAASDTVNAVNPTRNPPSSKYTEGRDNMIYGRDFVGTAEEWDRRQKQRHEAEMVMAYRQRF